jgi:hypothetical protein
MCLSDDTEDAMRAIPTTVLTGAVLAIALAQVGAVRADVDHYLVANRAFSSYQFVVDGQTGDLDLTSTDVQRLDHGGSVGENASVDGSGGLVLRWHVGEIFGVLPGFIRVQGALCGTQCGTLDRYRVRFEDTTCRIPRFNNTGSQTTVLLVQNAIDRACTIVYHYLRNDGSLITSTGFGVEPRELQALGPVNGSERESGSVRVAHTCGYGGLSGKAVSIEPATGFTFDTPLVPRPH